MFRQKKMKTTVFEKPSELSKFRRFSAENPLIWGSLLVLFFALLTYLIGPSYRSESLNFSPGEIARKTFVTRIPFTIERPNPNLEAERNKLAAQVPTYYVFSRGKLVDFEKGLITRHTDYWDFVDTVASVAPWGRRAVRLAMKPLL